MPPRPAPRIAVESSPEIDWSSDAPGCLHQDSRLALWWGSPTGPAGGPEASWCLGWPAESTGYRSRLVQWQRHCLPLRQAAEAHGLTLLTGSDPRGNWLLASGDPCRLPSVVEQTLKHWLKARRDTPPEATHPAAGLIAQRLLCELESCPAPQAIARATSRTGIAEPAPALLCWARGSIDAETARLHAYRFAERLPKAPPRHATPPDTGIGEPVWLTPQGSDQAVMLEVAGHDDTPRSRFLLQFIAQCHDAAFQHAMRQRHGFGYVAAVRYREATGWPRLGYVVQSPHASVEAVRLAIEDFLQDRGVSLACLEPTEFSQRLSRLAASQGSPETHLEGVQRTWQALRRRQWAEEGMAPSNTPWPPPPWEEEQAALASLTASDLAALADALVVPGLPRRWWFHAPR
ncbi:hypothetical protein [Halomonas sp. BC04]|uniref:hypothetical protein n=1 Tax=Halomonas sp. BC04 TaxID=1403540 RepID=UPI0012DC2B12|nr:hypothetical protein [Halomonas sp. BC04]